MDHFAWQALATYLTPRQFFRILSTLSPRGIQFPTLLIKKLLTRAQSMRNRKRLLRNWYVPNPTRNKTHRLNNATLGYTDPCEGYTEDTRFPTFFLVKAIYDKYGVNPPSVTLFPGPKLTCPGCLQKVPHLEMAHDTRCMSCVFDTRVHRDRHGVLQYTLTPKSQPGHTIKKQYDVHTEDDNTSHQRLSSAEPPHPGVRPRGTVQEIRDNTSPPAVQQEAIDRRYLLHRNHPTTILSCN